MATTAVFFIIGLPIVELWLLIKVGSVIGATWTIVLIIATAVIGGQLVRQQGIGVLQKARQEQLQGRMPAQSMLEGLALLLAGVFLVLPGILTDIIGFLLLIPPLRNLVVQHFLKKMVIIQTGGQTVEGQAWRRQDKHNRVIEGEYKRHDEEHKDR